MRMTFLFLWVALLVFPGPERPSWAATLGHDSLCVEDGEITAQPVQSKDLHEDFEKQIRSLLKDLEKLEKEAKEKMTKEILPYLREEIERIKKWLKDFRLDKEKEDQPERIRV